jgi:predicted amidohydrolase
MRVALAQINPTVGDIAANSSRILDFVDRAKKTGAELVVFPELSVIGYPPKDLLLKPQWERAPSSAASSLLSMLADLRSDVRKGRLIQTSINWLSALRMAAALSGELCVAELN